MNGSLGVVVEEAEDAEGGPALACRFDGVEVRIPVGLLNDLELGYAVTAHKAQGSQWPVVIVPVFKTGITDRTLIYTAITRAQRHVILLGNREEWTEAVSAPPSHSQRQVGLSLSVAAPVRTTPFLAMP